MTHSVQAIFDQICDAEGDIFIFLKERSDWRMNLYRS